jgi:hypothetical protein
MMSIEGIRKGQYCLVGYIYVMDYLSRDMLPFGNRFLRISNFNILRIFFNSL